MRIYNTLSGVKEEFKPLNDKLVKIYVCGPTVYDHSHIGHGRIYVVYDVLERYLRFIGYDVMKVINITDVDDKIIKKASELNMDTRKLAEVMTTSFLEDIYELNILLPEFMPRATHHIQDMIYLISRLIDKKYAYESEGDVYFDVSRFREYGKLSKQSVKNLIIGRRIEPSGKKRNPIDFTLWKRSKAGEPYWSSPWGDGRPGWHIECSAMSMKLLGEVFDIHGGGEDLIFPHHENELAQSKAATEKKFARYWMHCGLVMLNKEEMSKSKGNVISLKEILRKYGSNALRILYLSTHYRVQLEFDWDRLENARDLDKKIIKTYERVREITIKDGEDTSSKVNDTKKIQEYRERIIKALDDDLNTPLALSEFLSFVRWVNWYLKNVKGINGSVVREIISLFRDIFYIFGLKIKGSVEKTVLTDDLIKILIDMRKKLRVEKEYELADYIRERLREIGIALEDVDDETKYHYIK